MAKKESPSLYTTERVVKKAAFYGEELPLPNDESYYDDLHDRIMASIERTEIKPVPHFKKEKDLLKRHWRFYVAMSMMILVTVMSAGIAKSFSFDLFQNSHAIKSAQNEDQIISIISMSPEMLSDTILTYKSEQELFADSSVFQNETLTKEVFEAL